MVLKVCIKIKYLFKMREWLRGGAPPCQGGGRGFESRLALFYYIIRSLKLQDFRLFFVLSYLLIFSIISSTIKKVTNCNDGNRGDRRYEKLYLCEDKIYRCIIFTYFI